MSPADPDPDDDPDIDPNPDTPGTRPISIAQAWSAPIIVCAAGVAFVLWGFRAHPESREVTAAIVIMIVAPVTATALIARGIVGLHQKHLWRGALAIVVGVLLIAIVIAGLGFFPARGAGTASW